MPLSHRRLTALSITAKKPAGYYADGDGLYLQVTSNDSRSWIYRFMLAGRRREMGLGALRDVTLADARTKATAARQMVKAGQDPIEARNAGKSRQRLEEARSITFDKAAELYIAAHKGAWRNPVHCKQWKTTLAAYASPLIGSLSVGAVGTPEVTKVLDAIWATKTETASRVRGRIELILDWAKARGYRTGENPARWRGHLDAVYPRRSKLQKVQHFEAVPIDEMPAVYARLCHVPGIAALAARFTILTAVRVSVTVDARDSEFGPDIWSIGAERMKAGRDHNVPLSTEAKAVLELARHFRTDPTDDRVFPGQRAGRGVWKSVVLKMFRSAGAGRATIHGCRSTFKDWAMERTSFPPEVSEMALAHAIGDRTEAAYRRGELLKKRTTLMEAWARFLTSPASLKVVPLHARAQVA
jgi:integrase